MGAGVVGAWKTVNGSPWEHQRLRPHLHLSVCLHPQLISTPHPHQRLLLRLLHAQHPSLLHQQPLHSHLPLRALGA